MPIESESAASVEDPQDLYEAQLELFLDPNNPEITAQARANNVPDAWIEAAKRSPTYKMAVDWRIAFPLHPEYRTLPMVWYVPPLSPIQSHANAGAIDSVGQLPDVRSLRIPVRYLANLLTAGAEAPVVVGARTDASHAHLLPTAPTWRWRRPGGAGASGPHGRAGRGDASLSRRSPTTRIVSSFPTSHREQAEDAYGLRGSCGFTFGNGCDFGPPHSTLFGGKMGRRTLTPIRPLDT